MKRNEEMSKQLTEALKTTEIGKPIIMNFRGDPTPVEVKFVFHSGWVITQRLIPGMPLEFIRGEDGQVDRIDITLLPHDGLK